MTPYIIAFSSSYLFCILGENCGRSESHTKRKIGVVFLLFSVLIVAVLSGVRDYTVGSDTEGYTRWFIEWMPSLGSFTLVFKFFSLSYEPGFVCWGYLIGKLFDFNGNWFLFWCAVIIFGFTMKVLWELKDSCSISLAWLIFLLVSCTEFLNITRQYMAMAIGTYAFVMALKNKNKTFILLTLVATSMHYSAILYFFIFYIYRSIEKNNNFVNKARIVFIVLVGSLMYSVIFSILARFGIFAEKLSEYTNFSLSTFQVNPFLIRLPFLILILAFKEVFIYDVHKEKKDSLYDFFIIILIIDLIMSQLRGVSVTLYRLTSLFMVFKSIIYSRVVKYGSFISANRFIMRMFLYVYLIIVFIYWTITLNSGLIYPYTSSILGIK